MGAVAGGLIPESYDGFDFALTGLFSLLFVDALAGASRKLAILAAAGVSIAVGLLLPRELFLLGSMLCYAMLCFLLVRYRGRAGRSGPAGPAGRADDTGRSDHSDPDTAEGTV